MPTRDRPATGPHAFDLLDAAVLVGPGRLAGFEHIAEIASTMDRARELAAEPAAALPWAVVADRQFAGRGRRDARWWQPAGSLVTSLVVEVAKFVSGSAPPAWSLACGVAVAETIRSLEPTVPATVRWPNDVEVEGRKLAGILVETAAAGRVIFGIGVNTTGSAGDAPRAIAGRVATLPDLVGRPLPRRRLLASLVPRLLDLLRDVAEGRGSLVDRYRPLCCLTGRQVRVHRGGEAVTGDCGGITADGRLILETPRGRVLIASGSLSPPEAAWRGE